MIEGFKKLWPGGKLKKDHFLIMILIGILFLVIMWPAQDRAAPLEESGLWDNYSAIIDSSANVSEAGNTIIEVSDNEIIMNEMRLYAEYLEAKLEEIIQKMDGAGRTKAMITIRSSGETIVEKDSPTKRSGTTEVDSAGGSRNTSDIETGQETVFYTNRDGRQVPFTKKTINPVIEGVLIVTQGGGNEIIIRNITDAIKALFGVDEHKIKVVKMIS